MRGGYFGTRPFGVPGWSCGYCLWHCRCSRAPSGRVAVCARGRRPARSPSAPRASLGASSRSPARPCRRPRTPRPCPPHRQRCVVVCGGQALPPPTDTAVVPSGPCGTLHTGGAVSLCVVARPCRRPRIPRPCLRALRHPPPCGLTWFRVWQTQAGKLRSGQWGLFYGRCPIRLLRGLCGPCGAEAGTSPCRGAIGPHRRIQKRPGP